MDGKKLKRLLELKKRLEKVRKGEVVEARQELDAAQEQLQRAEEEQAARLAELQGENLLSPEELADRARFVVLAGQRLGVAREEVTRRDQVMMEREEARISATRDVRTFELLSERHKEERRVAERRQEQGAADEVAGSRRSSR